VRRGSDLRTIRGAKPGVAALLTGNFYRPGPVGSTPRALYEVYGRLQPEF
jgi:hypothetical protein